MRYLRLSDRPRLRKPTLIAAFAGWNDASEVATWSARFLVKEWAAVKFADIDPEEFFVFTQQRPQSKIVQEDQRRIEWPANEFFYYRGPQGSRDFIVLVGVEPHLKWKAFVADILELVKELEVSLVFTLGGLLADASHALPPRVSGSSTDPELQELLADRRRVRNTPYQGPTGITGVLNTACNQAGIPTASVWGNVPHYLSATPNLKVATGILRRLNAALDLRLDLTEAETLSARFESQVAEAIARNPEVASYARELEEQESGREEESPSSQEDLPSGQALIQDLEDYLRRRRETGDQA